MQGEKKLAMRMRQQQRMHNAKHSMTINNISSLLTRNVKYLK